MPNKMINTQIPLRTWFAGLAMQGLCASSGTKLDRAKISSMAYEQADSMLTALNATKSSIDWNKAPDWATAHAVDSDGRGGWYEVKPEPDDSEWIVTSLNSRSQKAPNFGFQGEWTKSLVLRGES